MINFEKVRWQNLLSTGNVFTEVLLNKSKSTLIVGNNGCGKSSMLDALHFALFGKPFRNINKPQLINSITNKNLLVEVEFTTNNKHYLVRRGIKPNRFEIYQNEKLVNESSNVYDYQEYLEKSILKFNSKTFKQIVVLGSADYVPFMQLNSQSRRDVIEDLLDIQIFTTMSLLLRDKASSNKTLLSAAEYELRLLEEKIKIHRDNAIKIQESIDRQNQERSKEVRELLDSIEQLKIDQQQLQAELSQLSALEQTKQKLTNKIAAARDFLFKYNKTVARIDKDISFYEHTENCPTCRQQIDQSFKSGKIDEFVDSKAQLEKTKIDADNAITKIQEQLKDTDSRLEYFAQVKTKLNTIENNITVNSRLIADIERQIKASVQQDNTAEETQKIIKQLQQDLVGVKQTKQQLDVQRNIINISQTLLKDGGIKSKIIKQYVPIINKLINKYLAALDFFVNFEIDESFNEKIKSRYRDEFTYSSFSEGEKLKIDLALMMTWRAVAKMRNSAATNLLIMDEIFDSSLDATGTEELLRILDDLGESTNVFVISHKGESLYDKFHSVIRFEKHNNFSRIAKTA